VTFRPFHVVRLDLPLDAETFDAGVRLDPALALTVCSAARDESSAWRALATAQVYHASSAKDELPRPWFVDAALLARCPGLLAVSTYGAGYDTVNVADCTRAGVCVVNQAGSNAAAVCEHAFGLMLGLSKRIAEGDRRLRRGERFARHDLVGGDLDGAVLGLVGLGHVGRRMAVLGAAFGMQVLAADPLLPREEIARRGAEPVALDELLHRADVVSLHCPLDAGSAGMIGAPQFAAMKRGALFVSTARGGVHDEAALAEALRSGHLGGAGLDVWAVEPPPPDHPLLRFDQVIATHHAAGVTRGARRRMASMAAAQIRELGRGMKPPRLVNPEVWPAHAERFERITGRGLITPPGSGCP
jgi:D-3-phosphoglycerate dehydrogenase